MKKGLNQLVQPQSEFESVGREYPACTAINVRCAGSRERQNLPAGLAAGGRLSSHVLEAATLIAEATALAEAFAEVEEFRATGIAATDNFNLDEAWVVGRKGSLDAFVRDDATNAKHAMHASAGV